MPRIGAYWITSAIQLFGLAIGVGGETYIKSWDYVAPGIEAIKVAFPIRLPYRLLARHEERSIVCVYT